jgi:hypothetical protein
MSKKSFTHPAMNFISQESIERVHGGESQAEETGKDSGAHPLTASGGGYRFNPVFIETKSKRTQLLLQPSVHEAIRQIAEDEGTSFNDYVNTLLREHAESRGAI